MIQLDFLSVIIGYFVGIFLYHSVTECLDSNTEEN
jgi:hypothetical protein